MTGKAKKIIKTTTRKIGRDARTGRFIKVKEAQRRKSTAIVEKIVTSRKVTKPGGTESGGPKFRRKK